MFSAKVPLVAMVPPLGCPVVEDIRCRVCSPLGGQLAGGGAEVTGVDGHLLGPVVPRLQVGMGTGDVQSTLAGQGAALA